MHRRLAAIMVADVVGYSRLMEADESGTLAALRDRRRQIVEPLVREHGGRVVKFMGDGVLVEFTSAVNALACALAMQERMAQANEAQPPRQIMLRIGINLGDVVGEGADIFGDGVNVAARIEALASPGGICVTEAVRDAVRGKITAAAEDLGETALRNIDRPVRVWRFATSGQPDAKVRARSTVQDRPSVAVLPFTNMSGDPEQEYFSDGITEDIITDLSRFRSLFVIARNSSFTFKGKVIKIQDVAHELGVSYVVEGSVRKAGDRVRITAQLIEAHAGTHVWAERYDRRLDDVFEIQDEISSSIAAALAPHLLNAEVRRTLAKPESDLGTWEMLIKARWYLSKPTREANSTARVLLAQVIAAEPGLAQAYSLLALAHVLAFNLSWADPAEAIQAAAVAAQRAVSLDSEDAVAQAVVGLSLAFEQRHAEGIGRLKRAIELNPNLAEAHGYLGVAYGLCGDYDACRAAISEAFRLSPHDTNRMLWYAGLGIGAFVAGRYQEVLDLTTQALRDYPGYVTAHRQRAAALAVMGRLDEARRDIDAILSLVPDLTISQVRVRVPIRGEEAMDVWLSALRKAGLPE